MVDDNSQTRVMRKPCRIVPGTKSVGNYWQPREGMNLWACPVCPMNEGMNFCACPTHIKCCEVSSLLETWRWHRNQQTFSLVCGFKEWLSGKRDARKNRRDL